MPATELIDEIERARRDLLDLLRAVDPNRLAVPIGEGRWTATQYLEHLVRAEEATFWRMYKAIDDSRRLGEVFESSTPDATIEEIVERTWGERVDAPPLAVPQLGEPGAYWMVRMERNASLADDFADRVTDEELDALAYPHPISGPFTLRQGLQFVRFHIDRHREQLEAAGVRTAE